MAGSRAKRRPKAGKIKPRTARRKVTVDDCVVHDHPVPADEIARYSPVRDPDSEQDIANYVHGQARDETVQHVEKVKTEYVIGEAFDIWDVTMDKNRWWVLTNMTNLYSQKHVLTTRFRSTSG